MMDSSDKIREAWQAHVEVEKNHIERVLHLCQSPMESLMLFALLRQPYVYRLRGWEAFASDRDGALYYIQKPVTVGGTTYHLDFAVTCGDTKVAVEVDGHDFHERTKEQARKDKRRDRALTVAGWKILRFAGSEVFADAVACAWQVFTVVHPEWADEEGA